MRSPSSEGRVGAFHLKTTSLGLIRKFQSDWYKISSLKEAETAIRLSIKLCFAVVGLSTSDSIWGLLLLFFNKSNVLNLDFKASVDFSSLGSYFLFTHRTNSKVGVRQVSWFQTLNSEKWIVFWPSGEFTASVLPKPSYFSGSPPVRHKVIRNNGRDIWFALYY